MQFHPTVSVVVESINLVALLGTNDVADSTGRENVGHVTICAKKSVCDVAHMTINGAQGCSTLHASKARHMDPD